MSEPCPGCAAAVRELEKRMELQFELNQRALALQFTANEKAVGIALRESDRHFDHVNQFQQRIERLEQGLVSKQQLEDRLAAMFAKIIGLTLAGITVATFILGLVRGRS